MNLKAIFALMNTTQAVVKIRPEKNSGLYGIWTHDLCDTELTSQLGAGPQFIDTIFINLQLFILPLTGLFGINIMTSSQLAYTTVRLSAFNYRCLQLTRLVQRRSLQNNAYGYLTERQIRLRAWLNCNLDWFDCSLNRESMVLGNTVYALDEKNTSLELLLF